MLSNPIKLNKFKRYYMYTIAKININGYNLYERAREQHDSIKIDSTNWWCNSNMIKTLV